MIKRHSHKMFPKGRILEEIEGWEGPGKERKSWERQRGEKGQEKNGDGKGVEGRKRDGKGWFGQGRDRKSVEGIKSDGKVGGMGRARVEKIWEGREAGPLFLIIHCFGMFS